MNDTLLAIIKGVPPGIFLGWLIFKLWPRAKKLGTSLYRPFNDTVAIQKRANLQGAAAREHQTKPETRGVSRPVSAVGGISTFLQFQGRYDANGVILELPAQPESSAAIHGFTENEDGSHSPRTVLQGCEGSHWVLSRQQIRIALTHYLSNETSIAVDRVPPAISELLINIWPEQVEFRYPYGGRPVLRVAAVTDPWDLPVAELLAWALELHQHPSPPDARTFERLHIDIRDNRPLGATQLDVFLYLEYVGAEESMNIESSAFEMRREFWANRALRRLNPTIQSGMITDAHISNVRAFGLSAGSIRASRIVSPDAQDLTANNPGQIESSSSNASNEQRPRRMRIRGRQ